MLELATTEISSKDSHRRLQLMQEPTNGYLVAPQQSKPWQGYRKSLRVLDYGLLTIRCSFHEKIKNSTSRDNSYTEFASRQKRHGHSQDKAPVITRGRIRKPVALFFCVLAISASISFILSRIPISTREESHRKKQRPVGRTPSAGEKKFSRQIVDPEGCRSNAARGTGRWWLAVLETSLPLFLFPMPIKPTPLLALTTCPGVGGPV